MAFRLEHGELDFLIGTLAEVGFEVIGPTVKQDVIQFDRIQAASDLPVGWTDDQEAGKYRLVRSKSPVNKVSYFNYVVGPESIKKFVFPAREKLFVATQGKKGQVSIEENSTEIEKPIALLGVRSCDLAGLEVLDKVFLGGEYKDPNYQKRRDSLFFVAVQCTTSASTCFCHTAKTGPKAKSGFDLALTEVMDEMAPFFLVEEGSSKGKKIIQLLKLKKATAKETQLAQKAIKKNIDALKNNEGIDQKGIKNRIYEAAESPHWDKVAEKCLSCANCTLVCPTCFCSTTEDVTDLKGDHAERWRSWDSCFTYDHSYIHGGAVRPSVKSRYRQWMTHKLAAWYDQYETSGCVGCGRCVSWCPVGIDLRQEVKEL